MADMLQEILSLDSCDHGARWLAVTQLKNFISRSWRADRAPITIASHRLNPHAPPDSSHPLLSSDQKAHLRVKLLTLYSQDDNQMAVQIAVIIAKVLHLKRCRFVTEPWNLTPEPAGCQIRLSKRLAAPLSRLALQPATRPITITTRRSTADNAKSLPSPPSCHQGALKQEADGRSKEPGDGGRALMARHLGSVVQRCIRHLQPLQYPRVRCL